MDHLVRAEALRLYQPPFRYAWGYIYDQQNQMVADEVAHVLRVRGWGRIGSLNNPEKLQDAVGELIAETLTVYWTSAG